MRCLFKVIFVFLTIFLSDTLLSQNIGINEDGSTPDASAILDIKASNKGFLMPRLTSTQRNSIASPAVGLTVYDTSTDSFWFFNGTQWEEGSGKDEQWTVTGGNIYRATGNVGIGASSPINKLHLKEDSPGNLAIQFNGQYVVPVAGNRSSTANIGTSINASLASSWTGISNAATNSGGSFWTGGLVDDNDRSDILHLRFTNLSASIPLDATITGYQVAIIRRASDANNIYDYTIRLSNGSAQTGANKAITSLAWPTTFQNVLYGGFTDTWSTFIPISQINAGHLGVQIQYEGDIGAFSSDEQGYVDFAGITIYYTAPGSPSETNWVTGTANNEFRINSGTTLSAVPPFKVTSTGITELQALRMPTGAGIYKVLSSDANGFASWSALSNLSTDWAQTGNDLSNLNVGQVHIGGTWAGPFANSTYKLMVSGNTYSYGGSNTTNALFSISTNFGPNASSHLKFERSYGTIGAETPIEDGVLMGTIDFSGRRSTGQLEGAQISSRSAGDWSGTQYSADIRFSTKDVGTTALVERVVIDEYGWVGIGLMNPTFALHLPNDINNGEARAETWSTYSDRRIKTDIAPLQSSLSTLMQLQPVGYVQHPSEFKEGQLSVDESQGEPKQGFIAQDLYEVVPHAVHRPEDESKQLWGVDYSSLIPLLTSAIQEQQAEIEALKAQVKKLLELSEQ